MFAPCIRRIICMIAFHVFFLLWSRFLGAPYKITTLSFAVFILLAGWTFALGLWGIVWNPYLASHLLPIASAMFAIAASYIIKHRSPALISFYDDRTGMQDPFVWYLFWALWGCFAIIAVSHRIEKKHTGRRILWGVIMFSHSFVNLRAATMHLNSGLAGRVVLVRGILFVAACYMMFRLVQIYWPQPTTDEPLQQ